MYGKGASSIISSIPVISRPSAALSSLGDCPPPNILRTWTFFMANPGRTFAIALVARGRLCVGEESLMVDCDQVMLGADLTVNVPVLGVGVVVVDDERPSQAGLSVLVMRARRPRR